jgi:chemotaxis signal transduction protein
MSEHLLVQVGRETYALPVVAVRCVAGLDQIAQIPGAPSAIIGVSALRGELVPIVDVGWILGAARAREPERIVIAENGERVAGLAVDLITGVERIAEPNEDVSSPHLVGAALLDGALVGVVDIRALFDALDPGSEL